MEVIDLGTGEVIWKGNVYTSAQIAELISQNIDTVAVFGREATITRIETLIKENANASSPRVRKR